MKEFVYRFKNNKNIMLKLILIVSLVLLSSFSAVFLVQFAHPTIISSKGSKLFDPSNNIEETKYHTYDFYFVGGSISSLKAEEIINDFESILNSSSINAFKINDYNNYQIYTSKKFDFENDTTNTYFTRMVGVSNTFFASLSSSLFNSNSSEPILLSDNITDTVGDYTFTYNKNIEGVSISQNITITIPSIVNTSKFESYFSELYNFIEKGSLERIIFLPISQYIQIMNQLVIEENRFNLSMYIDFSDYQEDIMFWSINSNEMVSKFKTLIQEKLSLIDSSIYIHSFIDSFNTENTIIVNIVYSLIRTLQFLVWCTSLVIVILVISKSQKINNNQELFDIIAGKNWLQRLNTLFFQSVILTVSSLIISIGFLFPFIYLQKLFSLNLSLSTNLITGFGIITSIAFLTIFCTYLDFEFYLRRILHKGFSSENYKPFFKVPKIVKISSLLVIFLVVYLLNRNLLSVLYFAIIFITSIIISFLIYGILRILQFLIRKINQRIQFKKDKPLSPNMILFRLWGRIFTNRILIYSFLFSITCSAIVISSFNIDGSRSSFLFLNGSEITFDIKDNPFISNIDSQMNSNEKIIDFTKIISISEMRNESSNFYYRFGLEANNIVLANENFTGNLIYKITGISPDDFYSFFDNWNKNHWLLDGDLNNLNENTLFISKELSNLGYSLDDSLNFLNSTNNLTVKGIIDFWPTISYRFIGDTPTSYNMQIIMDYDVLKSTLDYYNSSYSISYKVHTQQKDVLPTSQFLISLINSYTVIEEMSYLDTEVIEGIKFLFLNPIITFVQILLLLYLSIFVYTHIDSILGSFESKTLGLIALSKDYNKALIQYKVIEFLIQIPIFLMVILILFFIGKPLIPLLGYSYPITASMISQQTILNLIILFLLFIFVLGSRPLFELLYFRRLNLSLIYRYPE